MRNVQAIQFLKSVTADKSNLLERLLKLLDANGILYCVIGSVAVGAYVEPMVSRDFDLVITSYQLGRFESTLASTFVLKRTPRTIEITAAGSDLRVNVFTESRYAEFVQHAAMKQVLGMTLPVASVEDVLRGKIWLYEDVSRKKSKRLSDTADIARLLEANPKLRAHVPERILRQIESVGA